MFKVLLDANCKFKIGQKLALRAQVDALALSDDKKFTGHPQIMWVVERWVHECYGGIQVSYQLRVTDSDYGLMKVKTATVRDLMSFTEPELVEYPATPSTDS